MIGAIRYESCPPEGVVYCVGTRDAVTVKIGWSNDLAKRLSDLQVAHAERLVVHATLPGTRVLERGMQELFADRHIRGEWFDNSDGEVVETFLGAAEKIAA